MSKNKRIDVVLLDWIMIELENRKLVCKLLFLLVEIDVFFDELVEIKSCVVILDEI